MILVRPPYPLIFAILAFPAAIMSTGCDTGNPPVKKAFVYGVSKYVDSLPEGSSPNLTWADDDAAAVAAMFENNGYETILRNDSSDPQEKPTKSRILLDLQTVKPEIDDTILMYFSGHGYKASPTRGACIVPYGAIGQTGILDPNQFIDGDELRNAFDALDCAGKIIILDTCFSGGLIPDSGSVDLIPQDYAIQDSPTSYLSPSAAGLSLNALFLGNAGPDSGIFVLSAAGSAEESWETSAYGHGIFTSFLLGAPLKGDADGNGHVTFSETWNYVASGINKEWNSGYPDNSGRIFSPHVSGGDMDIILFDMR